MNSTTTPLPVSAEKWIRQEAEMVTHRTALNYFPSLTFGDGNPMTVDEAAKHLNSVVNHISKNIELYQ